MRFVVLFCYCCLPLLSFAQSNEGTQFWMGFLEHRNVGENSMVVMITSRVNTSGVVRVPGYNWQNNFTVAANDVTLVKVPLLCETIGSETIQKTGIEVTAGQPVSVYIHQYHTSRSEASVVLPVASLGADYYVMTYTGYEQFGDVYPSEFLIVATEDNTKATVVLSDQSKGGYQAGDTFSIVLNKGQTYQVQGKHGASDLSGSRVWSDKKISVLSGNSWAKVPLDCEARDNLLEQMYPLSTWGKKFVTAPSAYSPYDVYRILAVEDDTHVLVKGSSTTNNFILNRGEFVEYQLGEPSFVSSDKPIAVAQFLIGSNCTGHPVGDPSMILLNSIEQIRDTVTLYNSPYEAIVENYINIIYRTPDAGNIRVDGQDLATFGAAVEVIPANPDFAFSTLPVLTGPHTLSTAGCGLIAIAYGYGSKESYAYGGGASFKEINANPVPVGGCLGDSIRFDIGLKAPRFSLHWDLGDGTQTTATAFKHVYADTGLYHVVLIINDLCLNFTDTIEKDLAVTIARSLEAHAPENLCVGDMLQFSTEIIPNAVYSWTGPDGFTADIPNPKIEAVDPANTGVYSVHATRLGCRSLPTNLEIQVHDLPEPDLGADQLICPRDLAAEVVLYPGAFASYRWSNNAVNDSIRVTQAGLYSVMVQDSNRCLAADSVLLTEICPTQLYIPNVFSPNDDGHNDYFIVQGTDILQFTLRIYDRWGGLVFETEDINGRWDGSSRGKALAPGVYIWIVHLEGYRADGSIFTENRSGDLTLLR